VLSPEIGDADKNLPTLWRSILQHNSEG